MLVFVRRMASAACSPTETLEKTMKKSHQALAAAIALVLSAGADAAVINQVSYASLTGTQLITFDNVAGGNPPGANYDGILVSGGASFAERFAGQVNTPVGGFDVLSGKPTGPLSLTVGAPGQNLNVLTNAGSKVLDGLGPAGFPSRDAIGSGAFAVLFPNDTAQFGFQLIGSNNGTATLDFFMRDGALIDSIVLASLADTSYGFRRERGIQDIAGISIFNSDDGGIAFDNLQYDARPLPVPGTLALLGLGLACLAARQRIAAG